MPSDYENDELVFLDEESHTELERDHDQVWKILVVDDDEEIHTVTRLALSDLILHNKPLEFHHAYSGAEARACIEEHGRDLAMILLDVVMESDDAGFQVVKYLRDEAKLMEPRIILRTGQPGFAPEEDVIKNYDINDYKTKTELTRSKLLTSVISSLRSYQQIMTINQSRLGLQKIISSSANLLEEHSIKGFCEGIVTQISSLIGLDAEGLVCAKAGTVLDKSDDGVYILGAAGAYASFINEPINHLSNVEIRDAINRCLKIKTHLFESTYTVLYLNGSGYEAAVFLSTTHEMNEMDKGLLEVFLSSISVGYENVYLFHELRNAAFKDWLTRLPNRTQFINVLNNMVPEAGQKNSVALVDINHFSDINDGLGQELGNELLKSVADRLRTCFPESIEVARIGADVYGIAGNTEQVNEARINDVFQDAFKAGDYTLPINVKIGLCEHSGEALKGTTLLKRANIALNLAKRSLSDNFAFFAPEVEEETAGRINLIRKLRTDFTDRKLELWFQPQVDLATERVVGMEGLLRWPDGSGGYIPPGVFVPLAEYSGLIVDIGQWVLEESCRRLAELDKQGYADLRIAVNVSIPQFRDKLFVEKVLRALETNDCEPERLELEITESVVMDEPQIVIDALTRLKSHGVAIAIDDFGTGFSSMSYLQKFPLDRLKVDRSFVSDIRPGQSAFIAETIVTLGAKLGLSTIAEGVETREQANYMIKLGCDEAQGYLFAKPMPFDALISFLSNYQK
ncbi:EAL domain-containing protein [Alteromonas sediminis]|uniref:EAL domain-containing protein n=1 Tax=Alteromonas sediminis TaxID=2259342 RepID=A0A3N5Y6U4_9ALTE|nr:EAL domain-containing protein [Alteromonas sediminis]RPJ66249.1 EAL domain-containing protein [Alteromonas sediminis]